MKAEVVRQDSFMLRLLKHVTNEVCYMISKAAVIGSLKILNEFVFVLNVC
jgi:hypothetical protein